MRLNNVVIDMLPLSLLLFFVYGAKLVKPLYSLNTEGYLSVDTSKYYRGLFASVILFHHLAQRTETGITFRCFSMVGFLAVAFFFFLSGYGLQKSYITKSDSYKKGFILKRIPSVLIPYIIITVFYWLMYLVGGQFYSLKDIIFAVIDGRPIVSYSWYIICILVFYVVYWLLMLICRKNYFLMILGGTVWYFLYAIFCIKMDYGDWWYNTSQLLIIGMFWATYERKIIGIIKKAYVVIAPVIWIVFIILFLFRSKIAALINIPYISTIIKLFTAIFFVLSVIMFSFKIQIGNKVLGFLGEISLEIYISQGLFIQTLRSSYIYIENELLWCIAVLVGTIIFSYVLHIAFQFILKKYKLMLCKLKINLPYQHFTI